MVSSPAGLTGHLLKLYYKRHGGEVGGANWGKACGPEAGPGAYADGTCRSMWAFGQLSIAGRAGGVCPVHRLLVSDLSGTGNSHLPGSAGL